MRNLIGDSVENKLLIDKCRGQYLDLIQASYRVSLPYIAGVSRD